MTEAELIEATEPVVTFEVVIDVVLNLDHGADEAVLTHFEASIGYLDNYRAPEGHYEIY